MSARVLAVAVALVVGVLAFAQPTPAFARITAREVVGDLDEPVAFAFGPGELWYVERSTGRVWTHDLARGTDRRFVTVRRVSAQGERGLLGIALHPSYPDEPFVYVYVTRSVSGVLRNQIVRYRDGPGSRVGRRVVFSSRASSSAYHNGGRIAFGPDGMLYGVVGDGHDASNAQELSDPRGKIIRIEPDGDIPPSNPFDNRIWAYGIRNSFGFAFDPRNDRLWETDNGPACNDEINLIEGGSNYGWGPSQTCQGTAPGNTNQDGADPVLPAFFLEQTVGITGIAFCDGCRLGRRSRRAAFFGAVNHGRITRISFNDARDEIDGHAAVYDHGRGTLSFEVGPGGRIYFSDVGGIYRLVRVRTATVASHRSTGVPSG